jgi:hypothetical protein
MTITTIDDHASRVCTCHTDEPATVLSRHSTSQGVVVWVRCACGALNARFRPYGDRLERVVASGGP